MKDSQGKPLTVENGREDAESADDGWLHQLAIPRVFTRSEILKSETPNTYGGMTIEFYEYEEALEHFGITQPDNTSADKPSSWATTAVEKANANGLATGELNKAYQSNTTRAEFCRAAVNFLRKYGYVVDSVMPKLFADTSDKDIGIAAALGITSGTDTAKNLFSPDGTLTREQAATMLRNVLNVIGKDTTSSSGVQWTDAKDIASWAKDSADYMYSTKIMGGTSTTALVFSPKTPYTHEQAIITIQNLWDAAANLATKQVPFGISVTVRNNDETNNTFAETIETEIGGTVEFQIYFKNTGNEQLQNVVVKNTLPKGMTYVDGSTQLANVNADGKLDKRTVADGIVAGGIAIGGYLPGGDAYILFQAKVDNNVAVADSTTVLRNIATAKAAVGDKEDAADIVIKKR